MARSLSLADDHREDNVAALDLDSFENVNVAPDPANAQVVRDMTALAHARFGSPGCGQL